ncbi:hypothetical protein [Halocella sp. SP3-1]|uniref:hypothetical protein n=1 Tax=Halocella sp. SP3-1 TaxID=2382161 RepID=UPI000F761CBB|nr:hypothetical protein [Halocella sp. SP3-1]AZO94521.1 hypothetical protein D7D81_07890 [Halocella sp. SP3-1]
MLYSVSVYPIYYSYYNSTKLTYLSGKWIDKVTNINNVNIKGIHLRLSGYENGPTLEVFEYKPQKLRNSESEINAQGFGHIAFHVDAVDDVLEKVLQNGGKKLGQIIKKDYGELGVLTSYRYRPG